MFAANAKNRWQVWTQWHQESDTVGGSPPLEFTVVGDQIVFAVNKPNYQRVAEWRAPLNRGMSRRNWHTFTLHVRWSTSDAKGFVRLWHNAAAMTDKPVREARVATMYPGQNYNYLKQGYYRSGEIPQDGVVYHDGMRKGKTWQSVSY